MKLALACPPGNSITGCYFLSSGKFLLVLECLIGIRSEFCLSLVADEYWRNTRPQRLEFRSCLDR